MKGDQNAFKDVGNFPLQRLPSQNILVEIKEKKKERRSLNKLVSKAKKGVVIERRKKAIINQ